MADVSTAILVYFAGVLVGLALTDAPPAARIGLALLWPLGPAAFLVTVAVLGAASFIAYPLVSALAVTAAGAMWWWIAR